MKSFVVIILMISGIAIFNIKSDNALSHALFNHSEPRVGETVNNCPKQLRIWFDSPLEPSSSTVRVESDSGDRVDNFDGHVDPSDLTILEVNLPCLPPGTYKVYWKVISSDGHSTNGNFDFTIE